MSSQLIIPFKRTTQPPIADAVHKYISKFHPETSPDDFGWDISHWVSLRADANSGNIHASAVDTILRYHAQLVLMLTKLPVDIDLQITYSHAFQPSQQPLTLSNLAYERVCVLFNLAALFCELAEGQDRTSADGIRRASAYYQNAAGTFTYILENAIPPFVASLTHPMSSSDLAKPVVKTLEYLMLAQAAECYWQKAVMDPLRNGTIARLSMQVASFYGMAHNSIQSAHSHVASALPSTWTAHLLTKQRHFEAAAQVRKSMDDSENGRYGAELGRLANARSVARQGQESARRGVEPLVVEDITALVAWIEERTGKAQRDNDYIYHQEVPPISALEPIEPANLVNSAILAGLRDPQTALNGEEALFGNLTSWGARMAIEIYNDRKHAVLADIRQTNQDLDRVIASKLEELNLPAGLELMDRPLALPHDLLDKAAEIRADQGPLRIRQLLEDVEGLSKQDRALLNEAYDTLDQEVEEDDGYRQKFGSRWTREPSHLANGDLTSKARHFSTVLEQARETDMTVKEKWRQWKTAIETLASDEENLRSLPVTGPTGRSSSSPLSTQTKSHARILRGHLESLEEIRRNRQYAVIRAQNLADNDDISDRIKLVALGLERWTQVKAEMFEDVMAEELNKYEKYQVEVAGTEEQDSLLKKIEERNSSLLQSRRDDPINKNVEAMVKNLNAAYAKYKEIIKNCTEGLTFYNDFADHLTTLRDSCKEWAYSRRQDVNDLVEHLELLSLEASQQMSPVTPSTDDMLPPPTLSPPGSSTETTTSSPPASPTTSRGSSKKEKLTPRSNATAIITDLPHPGSSQWEPLVPLPGPSSSPVVRAGVGVTSTKAKRQSRDESSPKPAPQGINNTSGPAAKAAKPKRQVY